jgi:hypothetical protein
VVFELDVKFSFELDFVQVAAVKLFVHDSRVEKLPQLVNASLQNPQLLVGRPELPVLEVPLKLAPALLHHPVEIGRCVMVLWIVNFTDDKNLDNLGAIVIFGRKLICKEERISPEYLQGIDIPVKEGHDIGGHIILLGPPINHIPSLVDILTGVL